MSISPAWGDDGDQYTILFTNITGGAYLADYQLGGSVTNIRSVANVTGIGNHHFSRVNPRILYILTSSQLRRYDTATDSLANTGSFPYSWASSGGGWFMMNDDETWATAKSSTSSTATATALNLTTGSVITQGPYTSFDDFYAGSGNVAFINRGGTNSAMWDLDANTVTTYSRPNSNFAVVHVPTLDGYWVTFDPNTGSGSLRWTRNLPDGSNTGSTAGAGYWGQIHNSGFWRNGSGADQWFLMSCWDNSGTWTAGMRYSLNFVEASGFTRRVLGHHYSLAVNGQETNPGGTDGYWSQPHATQSPDGKLVMFGSNMLDSSRIDVFLMEVPRAA
jgi:hypothetical protein